MINNQHQKPLNKLLTSVWNVPLLFEYLTCVFLQCLNSMLELPLSRQVAYDMNSVAHMAFTFLKKSIEQLVTSFPSVMHFLLDKLIKKSSFTLLLHWLYVYPSFNIQDTFYWQLSVNISQFNHNNGNMHPYNFLVNVQHINLNFCFPS